MKKNSNFPLTKPVLDNFRDCCKDWSWNGVFVSMVVKQGCYCDYVIQRLDKNQIEAYGRKRQKGAKFWIIK